MFNKIFISTALFLIASPVMAFPQGQLSLVSGPSECHEIIEIKETDTGFTLSNEFRVFAEFSALNEGRQCYSTDPSGRIFRRVVCEKATYEKDQDTEILSRGICDSDIGLWCNTTRHTLTLETLKEGRSTAVRLTQYDRYPVESEYVCIYKR